MTESARDRLPHEALAHAAPSRGLVGCSGPARIAIRGPPRKIGQRPDAVGLEQIGIERFSARS